MELDDELLDLGFLDHPPCQVVVCRVYEVRAPGGCSVIIRIVMPMFRIIMIIILNITIMLIMVILVAKATELAHGVLGAQPILSLLPVAVLELVLSSSVS